MKRRTSVYLRAARLVACSHEEADAHYARGKRYSYCCCGALDLAHATPLEEWEFAQVFQRSGSYWWRDPQHSMRDQQARVLALLFMHWMEVDP